MRLFISVILLGIVGNFVISIATPFFGVEEPAERKRVFDRDAFVAAYRKSPEGTERRMAAAYKACAKSELHDATGADEFRRSVARMVLIRIFEPAAGQTAEALRAALDKDMRAGFARLDETSRRNMVTYGEELNADGVTKCVFTSLT